MSRRREIEGRIALYGDLTGVIGAMRSFALVELRRLLQREAAAAETMAAVKAALFAVAPALPPQAAAPATVHLLIGSVRGFCGAFNEEIRESWLSIGGPRPAIVLGERLASLMPGEGEGLACIAGAGGAQDAANAIDRIIDALARFDGEGIGWPRLIALHHGERGATRTILYPLAAGSNPESPLPLTHEPAPQVAAAVAENFLYHSLHSILLSSLRQENHMRLMQMENALRHLARGEEELKRLRNRFRQEEIVEEIELIAGGRNGGRSFGA